ncbi:hypothetical protein ABPG72_017866 [Tetrahymena utriculariae]
MTKIKKNRKLIGGGLRIIQTDQKSLKLTPEFPFSNNVFQNIADIHGSDSASYLENVIIQNVDEHGSEQYKFQQNESDLPQKYKNLYQKYIEILEFRSGELINFKVFMYKVDSYNRYISFDRDKLNNGIYRSEIQSELKNIQISINALESSNILINREQIINFLQYNSSSQAYEIQDLQILGSLKTLVYFTIDSTIFTNSANSKPILLSIDFRNCKAGEIIQQINKFIFKSSQCFEGTYQLTDPQKLYYQSIKDNNDINRCINCPESAVSCKGNIIELKNGYWRESNNTDETVAYDTTINSFQAQNPNSINYCLTGYLGPICEQFDILGEIWKENHYSQYLSKNAKYLNKNHNKNSQDEVNLMQQIQILMQQGQANNSNQINQLNQTIIIQQKQQIQSLDDQVKQLHQELSKRETQNQKMNETNIQLKEKISSLEAKLQEFMQKPQQNNTYKFEPQQTQMKMNQQIQQIQPQQVAITWKPIVDTGIPIDQNTQQFGQQKENKKTSLNQKKLDCNQNLVKSLSESETLIEHEQSQQQLKEVIQSDISNEMIYQDTPENCNKIISDILQYKFEEFETEDQEDSIYQNYDEQYEKNILVIHRKWNNDRFNKVNQNLNQNFDKNRDMIFSEIEKLNYFICKQFFSQKKRDLFVGYFQDKKGVTCDSIFKIYYSTISPDILEEIDYIQKYDTGQINQQYIGTKNSSTQQTKINHFNPKI